MRRVGLAIATFLVAWAVASASATAAVKPAWAALEIGPLFPQCTADTCDDDISSWDINAKGWVVGDAFPDFHWAWIWKGDTMGNLVYRMAARNFNPMAATAGNVTLVEVEELVEPGQIDPDHVVTPGIFVNRIFQGTYGPKRIEKRTNR